MSAASRAITDLAAGQAVPPEHAIHRLALSSPGRRSTARSYPITDNIYLFGPDRLEIHSPGGLPGPMRIDNLLQRRYSRNRTLVQGLIALGVMEELGFGLDRVAAALQAEGLPLPDFVESDGSFIVTVRGHGRDLLTDSAARERQPVPPAGGAGSARRKQEQRQAWALERMRTVGPLTARDYATALGVSPNTALRDLRDLVSRGLAVASGTTNDRRYALRIDSSS